MSAVGESVKFAYASTPSFKTCIVPVSISNVLLAAIVPAKETISPSARAIVILLIDDAPALIRMRTALAVGCSSLVTQRSDRNNDDSGAGRSG